MDTVTVTDIIVAAIRIAIITPAMATVMVTGMAAGATADMAVAIMGMVTGGTMAAGMDTAIAAKRHNRIYN
jgi:hypothetical protein